MQELGIWILLGILVIWFADVISKPDEKDPTGMGGAMNALLIICLYSASLFLRVVYLVVAAWF